MERRGEAERKPEADGTEDLIRRAQAGDDQALNDLFALHYDKLRRFVRSKLGAKMRRGIDDSQDVLHSAFRGALKSFSEFEHRIPSPRDLLLWLEP